MMEQCQQIDININNKQQMHNKAIEAPIMLGSPKSVTMTLLNSNNFFTLDYQHQQLDTVLQKQTMSHTLNNFHITHSSNTNKNMNTNKGVKNISNSPILSLFNDKNNHENMQQINFNAIHMSNMHNGNIYRINGIKKTVNNNNKQPITNSNISNNNSNSLNQSVSITGVQNNTNIHLNVDKNDHQVQYTKSAQYSRKLVYTGRAGFHPYGRIKRVQAIIEQKKNAMSNTNTNTNTINIDNKSVCFQNKIKHISNFKHLCNTQRIHRNEHKQKQKQTFIKSLTISVNPQSHSFLQKLQNGQQHDSIEEDNKYNDDNLIIKKNVKTINSFSQNYKNRKKLLQKVTNRKAGYTYNNNSNSNGNSPIRSNTKPQDAVNMLLKIDDKVKHWSPYTGKLVNRSNDPLLQSIQGSKIKYIHHQPRYYKGNVQEVLKI